MFRVEWLASALNELAEIWTQADAVLRQAITAATAQIDQKLRIDPSLQGESRAGGRRVLFEAPLGITFRVEQDQQTAIVVRVWLFRRRGSP